MSCDQLSLLLGRTAQPADSIWSRHCLVGLSGKQDQTDQWFSPRLPRCFCVFSQPTFLAQSPLHPHSETRTQLTRNRQNRLSLPAPRLTTCPSPPAQTRNRSTSRSSASVRWCVPTLISGALRAELGPGPGPGPGPKCVASRGGLYRSVVYGSDRYPRVIAELASAGLSSCRRDWQSPITSEAEWQSRRDRPNSQPRGGRVVVGRADGIVRVGVAPRHRGVLARSRCCFVRIHTRRSNGVRLRYWTPRTIQGTVAVGGADQEARSKKREARLKEGLWFIAENTPSSTGQPPPGQQDNIHAPSAWRVTLYIRSIRALAMTRNQAIAQGIDVCGLQDILCVLCGGRLCSYNLRPTVHTRT